MATESVQKIVDALTLASLSVLPWRVIAALAIVAVYLAVDWKGLTPRNRLDFFKKELQDLERASYIKDTRDVLQQYGKADDIEARIRR